GAGSNGNGGHLHRPTARALQTGNQRAVETILPGIVRGNDLTVPRITSVPGQAGGAAAGEGDAGNLLDVEMPP
ncbi:MAG: hypothetical protein SWK90_13765, partial [Chloroflexota bacterium]|nr:hypothetical protein [Chloroflexota bacterium]